MGFPKILYESRLNDATPAASTTATDYDVLNLRDFRPYTWWKPTAMPATVTVDSAVARPANYAYLYGHSLHTDDAVVIVERSTDNFSASVVPLGMSNAVAYPEDFSNAYWTKTTASIVSNNAAAPDGTWTGDFLKENSTSAIHQVAASVASILPDSLTTDFTFFAMPGGRNWVEAILVNKAGTTASAYFNVSTGAVGTTSNCTASITSNGDGWYRCKIVFTSGTGATTPTASFRTATANTTDSYLGDGSSGVYLWGVQWSAGISAYQGNANKPLLFTFTEASYRYSRFRFVNRSGTTKPSVAIAIVGKSLDFPVYLDEGFDATARDPESSYNQSVKGHPLGRVIEYESFNESIKFGLLTWSWIRATWLPAWSSHVRDNPFVFAWDVDNYPLETRLVVIKDKMKSPHKMGGYADLSFDIAGVIP